MSHDHCPIRAKFRSCNITLVVETGRYTKPKTPHMERLGKLCDSAVGEGELYSLLTVNFTAISDMNYSNVRIIVIQTSLF